MSFLVIDRERFALPLGDTVLGGDADELLSLSALVTLPPFAVIRSRVDLPATICALPDALPVYIGGQLLTGLPIPIRHGARLVVGELTLLYGDTSAVGRTSMLAGVAAGPDPLSPWSASDGTASTGGRLIACASGAMHGIPDEGLVIGRDPECGLVVPGRGVSRRHATIAPGLLGYSLTDASTHGVLVNGVRIEGSAILGQRDIVRIGDIEFRFEADAAVFEPDQPPEAGATGREPVVVPVPSARSGASLLATLEVVRRGSEAGQRFRIERAAVQLGRAEHNDIRLVDDSVSATHATLLQRGGAWQLLDLGSRNGTYVDGERITERQLSSGCEIRVGNVKLLFRAIAGVSDAQATRGIVGLTEDQLRGRS